MTIRLQINPGTSYVEDKLITLGRALELVSWMLVVRIVERTRITRVSKDRVDIWYRLWQYRFTSDETSDFQQFLELVFPAAYLHRELCSDQVLEFVDGYMARIDRQLARA